MIAPKLFMRAYRACGYHRVAIGVKMPVIHTKNEAHVRIFFIPQLGIKVIVLYGRIRFSQLTESFFDNQQSFLLC